MDWLTTCSLRRGHLDRSVFDPVLRKPFASCQIQRFPNPDQAMLDVAIEYS